VIYPSTSEQKTDFDKIRQKVRDKCLSPLGAEIVDRMAFSSDFKKITLLLDRTDEFLRLLDSGDDFPTSYYFDVRYSLKRIRPEGTWLEERELFDLKRSLDTIRDIVRFFKTEVDEEPEYPRLSELAGDAQLFPKLTESVDRILDKNGNIRDNASPQLLDIRSEMQKTVSSISRSLQSILRSAQNDGVVDKDVTPTMRDGRLMIPVAPAFKRKIRGIVHDESASGRTVFIEPEVVVEANNRIRELEGEEKREIVRILTEFTDLLRPQVPAILQSYAFLAEIDFIRAKALFAKEIHAVKPIVEEKHIIDWSGAFHPLLFLSMEKQGKKVVPLDIELDDEHRILIISGPNAGGKSVCLKTVGLLQYMIQCGLPVPMYASSHMGIFRNIFIDIGDEQSIENDLSTYSSHLTNMKYFVRNCDESTLILIDEFGSGTEPQIGGAIAEALLDRFNRNRSFGVITTHYQNLKHFAEDTPGIVNGAMLYDRNHMKPLFMLSIGNPGSSFAIEIARQIGLPQEVIGEASAKVGSDYINMDKYLQDIVRDKRYWEMKRQNVHQQEKKLEELTERYQKDLEEVNKLRREIVRNAKDEAGRILSEANARIENTVREIKEAQAEKEQTKLVRKQLEEFKSTVSDTAEDDASITRRMQQIKERKERNKKRKAEKRNASASSKPEEDKPITVGDNVRLEGQTSAGTVLEIHGKQAVVAFGMIKSTVTLDRLQKVSRNAVRTEVRKETFVSRQTADEIREKTLNFKQEIDVRGMRADEALQTVTYYIDDAIQVGAARVRILHGTGTGALRQVIRQYLSTVPGVKKYADEHVQLGGAGITVVDFE
jgi:DNA mismatch repair protein MutS2